MTSKKTKPRKRAPRRDGKRTTLRIPPKLSAQAREVATALGTTPNDALLLFAERGALLYSQELDMRLHEERQLAAILEAAGLENLDAEYPPFEEARAAALFLRL